MSVQFFLYIYLLALSVLISVYLHICIIHSLKLNCFLLLFLFVQAAISINGPRESPIYFSPTEVKQNLGLAIKISTGYSRPHRLVPNVFV